MEPSYHEIQELRTKFNRKVQEENRDFQTRDVSRANSDDSWLRRFLLHHDLDQKEALCMMMDTCEWRRTNKINELNENNVKDLAFGSIFIHNKDKDGKPLLIFKCSKNVKGQKDFEELKRCVIYWFERADKMTDQITIFFDMLNTGLSNMDLEYTKYIINLCKLYYPNFLNYILIFEMPWILNAGFKVIKTWLPTKAVQKIKFVNRSNLKDFVDPTQALVAWGGTDPYEFVFTPDSSTNETSKTEENKKKVHFAGVSMNDQDHFRSFGESNIDDISSSSTKVRISPNDVITFYREGIEISGSFTITNTSEGPITFKVKTTSRDKFRVRPYCGTLSSGESVSVVILLVSDFKSSNIEQDKFLIMTLPVDNVSNGQNNEAWKANNESFRQNVEEFRLKCRLDSNSPLTSSHLNGATGVSSASNDLEQKMSQLLISVNHVSRICSDVESEMKTWRRLVVVLIMVTIGLVITIVYILSHLPENVSDPSRPEL